MRLEGDLRIALAAEQLSIAYQPLFDLRTRRIIACEALLRWPHRERGMVSPAEFIPVAEEMGLIVEIGHQVLRKACLECGRWPDDVRVVNDLAGPEDAKEGRVVHAFVVQPRRRNIALPCSTISGWPQRYAVVSFAASAH